MIIENNRMRITYILYGIFLVFIWSGCTTNKKNKEITTIHDTKDKDTIQRVQSVRISPKEVYAITQKKGADWVILDVRTPQEVAAGHISSSSPISIQSTDFNIQTQLLDKSKYIYVYCNTGSGRSDSAFVRLKKEGFQHIKIIKGGYLGWVDSNLPIEEGTQMVDVNAKTLSLEEFNVLLKSDKPVLIDFHTLWCASCVEMAPAVDVLKKEFEGKAIVKRINIATSKEIRKTYNIKGVPVFVIYLHGKKIWSHKGKIPIKQLEEALSKVI